MVTLAKSLLAFAALSMVGFVCPVLAGSEGDAGRFDVAYVKRDIQPIADGHILLLSESTGTNTSPGGGPLDGFAVSIRETADLDKGNGTHLGYAILSRGVDQQIVRVSGKVTTTLDNGQPRTTMAGTWEVVAATGALAGTTGKGTYSGYFTAEDKYHIDWKDSRRRIEPRAAHR
ncbi:MAG: hypothetical protein ACT4N2_11305 [Hyphomicrobium sp.]